MTTNNSDLLQAIDQALDERSLTWAARWIEDSLKGEPNERVIEFGKNMAMTIRAVKTKDVHSSDSARRAAEEIEIEFPQLPNYSADKVAAIISKHFAAVPVEQAPEALKRASKLCRSVIPGARVELIFQNLQDAQTVHEWLVTLATAAPADNDAELLLQHVAYSGVEFDDNRMGYVVVQIDRDVWEQIKKLAPTTTKGDL